MKPAHRRRAHRLLAITGTCLVAAGAGAAQLAAPHPRSAPSPATTVQRMVTAAVAPAAPPAPPAPPAGRSLTPAASPAKISPASPAKPAPGTPPFSARSQPAPAISAAPPIPIPHAPWRRDPFASPPVDVVTPTQAAAAPRPPGAAGLSLNDLAIQAVALGGANGPVALVEGPQKKTYFLRAGTQIYDARVVRVETDGVIFERGADAADPHAQVLRKVGQPPAAGAHTQ